MNKNTPTPAHQQRGPIRRVMVWMALFWAGVAAAVAQVAAPTMAPQAASAYPVTQNITVHCATSAAVIHYTTNGSDPTLADKIVVSGQTVTVNRPMTLKAKAFHATLGASAVTSSYYGVFGQVAAGGQHTLALTTDGAVWAWGYNSNGQLGDGTTTQRTIPGQIAGLTNVIAIATGDSHSVALKSDGTVWTWGNNGQGRLGDGTTVTRKTPVQVSGLTGIAEIAAGNNFTVALKNDGTVWAWGANGSGQLGDNTVTNKQTPVQVSGLTTAINIAAGKEHALALKADETVVAWGYNSRGQLGNNTTTHSKVPVAVSGLSGVARVEAGDLHSVAVKADGTVWCWGFNSKGQLGDGTTTDRLTPVQANGLTGATVVVAGDSHTLAVTGAGAVWAWGINDDGQLGLGNTTYKTTPQQVTALSGMVTISGGGLHSVAVKSDGGVWTWGRNNKGQLCDGTTVGRTSPVQARGFVAGGQVAQVANGGQHSLALSDGTVWTWGFNNNGQLGDGTTLQRTIPVQIAELSGVIALGAGDTHSVALKSDGTVWTWGDNAQGRLGDGTTTDRHTPVPVAGLGGVVEIAVGGDFNLARKSDGTVWAWGNNAYGKLGDNTTTNRSTPVQVSGLTTAVGLGAGTDHALAIKADGTVVAWGFNSKGQLGNNTLTNSKVPVAVNTLTGVIRVDGGFRHSVAVKDDGTIWCWGYNNKGQLGIGTTTDQKVPVQVSGLTGVVSVGAGDDHTMAVTEGGDLWAWGGNDYGQLGLGNTMNKTTPQQVTALSGMLTTAGAGIHSLGLKSDGTVWAWGRNIKGQLGDGTTVDRTSPVQVQGPPVSPSTSWLYLIGALLDSDGDGLPDWWEVQHGFDPNDNGSGSVNNGPLGDLDGDGQTNLQEYQGGTDPRNFFNGALPQLTIVSGNNQSGTIGTVLPQPLLVAMTNANGAALSNAPVNFTVTQGQSLLAAAANNLPLSTLNLRTDTNGLSSVLVTLPAQVGDSVVTVTAVSGSYSASVMFAVSAQEEAGPGRLGVNFSRGADANEGDVENRGAMAALTTDGFIAQANWNNLNVSNPAVPLYLNSPVDAAGRAVTRPRISFQDTDWLLPEINGNGGQHGKLFPDQTPSTPNTLGYIGLGDWGETGNGMKMTVSDIPYEAYDVAVLVGWYENGLRWHVFKADDANTLTGQDGWVGNTFTGSFSGNRYTWSDNTFTFQGGEGHSVYAVQILRRTPDTGLPTRPSNQGSLPLSSFQIPAGAAVGSWALFPDGTVRSIARRGPVDFSFQVSQPGVYTIELQAAAYSAAGSYTPPVPIIARVDDVEVGRANVLVYGSRHTWTRRLAAGTHKFTVDNRNVPTGVSMGISAITIYRSEGPDGNGNGIPDVLEPGLLAENFVDSTNTSPTSPMCIEGSNRYAGDTKVFVGAAEYPAFSGLAGRWFANVPLSATGSTDITAKFENGALNQARTVTWSTTNLAFPPFAPNTPPPLRVRRGDSLKVTAVPPDADGTTTTSFTLDGVSLGAAGPAADPRIVAFTTAGTFTLAASATTGATTVTTSVQVEVLDASFGPVLSIGADEPPLDYQTRHWDLPGIDRSLDVTWDAGLVLTPISTDPSQPRRYSVKYPGASTATPRVLARLWADGPIAAATQVNVFRFAPTSATGNAQIIETLTDGTRVVEGRYVFDGVVPADLGIWLHIFTAGASFADGTFDREITAADLDANGEVRLLFHFAAGAEIPRICHTIQAYYYSTVGDYVWEDTNGNGRQDTGETGLPNVTVKMVNPNDANDVIQTTQTNAQGRFQFNHIAPGSQFRLLFPTTLPGGLVLTTADVGGNDGLDSDADTGTGLTPPISLGSSSGEGPELQSYSEQQMIWAAGYRQPTP